MNFPDVFRRVSPLRMVLARAKRGFASNFRILIFIIICQLFIQPADSNELDYDLSVEDMRSFSSREEAVLYFEEIARSFPSYGEMREWLEGNGFVFFEYRGLEAGLLRNERAVRLLAGFSTPIDKSPPPASLVGQLAYVLLSPFERWSFTRHSTGITVLYSDETTLTEVQINPIGLN
ncbi:hypothetical protein [Amaricoccus macauensis]|uniref:hypothetical protein n=1 Tax=Amaricoccus macauensis TaxID=57001 RepID=UPI003C7CDB94